jgi:hypothetical protein
MNSKSIAVMVLLVALFGFGCKNPFLPKTGEPVEELLSDLRATPQGLLDQLIQSYESQQIELFTDLLPKDGSFRFFISPDYFNDYSTRYQQMREPRDPRLLLLEGSDFFYYWSQENEIENHEKLFSQAYSIEFKDKPALESVRKFVDNNDSMAELLVTGGRLEIGKPVGSIIEIYTTTVDKQVFLIKKNADKLWVILKWYDFSVSSE